jgi:hypothetical protein
MHILGLAIGLLFIWSLYAVLGPSGFIKLVLSGIFICVMMVVTLAVFMSSR